MKDIKQLIKNECANFNYENNFCFPKDKMCCFFLDSDTSPRCKYFEDSVLPLEPEMEYEYRKDRKMSLLDFQAREKICERERCGATFISHSNSQKYCEKCEPIMKRQKTRIRVRKHRNV
jgi:hypothetical protein